MMKFDERKNSLKADFAHIRLPKSGAECEEIQAEMRCLTAVVNYWRHLVLNV